MQDGWLRGPLHGTIMSKRYTTYVPTPHYQTSCMSSFSLVAAHFVDLVIWRVLSLYCFCCSITFVLPGFRAKVYHIRTFVIRTALFANVLVNSLVNSSGWQIPAAVYVSEFRFRDLRDQLPTRTRAVQREAQRDNRGLLPWCYFHQSSCYLALQSDSQIYDTRWLLQMARQKLSRTRRRRQIVRINLVDRRFRHS